MTDNFRPLRRLPKMNVGRALQRYVDLATPGLLDLENGEIIERLESKRGIPTIGDAARVLGPFSSWPLQRKRQFSRMLSEARSSR